MRLQKISQTQPHIIIAALTATCVFVFLATLFVPRIDDQLVGSDGTFYYMYLPSIWFDRDVDFTNQIEALFATRPERRDELLSDRHDTDLGIPSNLWPVGSAVLWSPAFLLAHGVANGLSAVGMPVDTTGHGQLYQAFVLISSIIYGGFGLWFCYRLAAELATPQSALIACALILYAGNLIYYMTVEPSMAHNNSVFASSLFFWTWYQRRDRRDVWTAALFGVLAGLMALIRPQDGLLVALPFLAQLPDVWREKTFARYIRNGLIGVICAFLVFAPQMIVWGQLYGDYFSVPYVRDEEFAGFHMFRPKLWQTLISSQRGLLTWHPIILFALIGGVYHLKGKARFWVMWGGIGFLLQWYIISAWRHWVQGDAFGGRMFLVCTPIFVLGLSLLVKRFAQRLISWRGAALASVFIGLNGLLLIQFRLTLLSPALPPDFPTLLFGRFQLLWSLLMRVVT